MVCPVCEKPASSSLVEEVNGLKLVRCGVCGLEFVESMPYQTRYYEELYYNATPALREIEKLSRQDYLSRGKGLLNDSSWQPYYTAMRWLVNNLKKGDAVLDVGCGAGWCLAALEAGGFKAVGVEVSDKMVALLQQKGFAVVKGPLEKTPENFCVPAAITLFEVMEHIQNPLALLKDIHRRFPGVPLVVSVPTPRSWTVQLGIRSYCDYPPNHLTRWSETSLKAALNSAGYNRVNFEYSKIPVSEVYGGVTIWLTNVLGLRKKGYFGELAAGDVSKTGGRRGNILVGLFYPLLNAIYKITGVLFIPLGAIIALACNSCKFTSYCVVAIAQTDNS